MAAAEESMVATGAVAAVSVAAAAVSAEVTDKSTEENHAVWSDHITENKTRQKWQQKLRKQQGTPRLMIKILQYILLVSHRPVKPGSFARLSLDWSRPRL